MAIAFTLSSGGRLKALEVGVVQVITVPGVGLHPPGGAPAAALNAAPVAGRGAGASALQHLPCQGGEVA